ncbi:sugar ABC transporter permease [Paenibacillus sp. 598K]|uniref:ABC transporter permease n=1 Tax=Paenibacillus sp. 598K TaxID=1117987 RepID=UPI000FFAEA37|nr:ABC transporter permease subunit [Paenibacillus sp. 598K]GBF71897.1 sugar ABC transporter permease [Paenibacillus sp. 598K]
MRRIGREWKLWMKHRALFTLSLPGVLYLLIIAYIPMAGIVVAFKDYRYDLGIAGSEWIGFKNFEFLFASEATLIITRNTVLYNASYILIGTSAALLLALLMNEITGRWVRYYQTAMFLPHFLSWVVVGYVTYAFLDQQNGFANQIMAWLGLQSRDWYFEPEPWPYLLNLVHLWKTVGFSALVYYAGIMGIDSDYYEAAKLDGANRLQMALRITLPMLTPLVLILLIVSIGQMFRGDFGLHYFIPNNSGLIYSTTDVIDTYVYRALRMIGDIGMSSAVGVYQSVVGLILVFSANAIIRKINPDNSLW